MQHGKDEGRKTIEFFGFEDGKTYSILGIGNQAGKCWAVGGVGADDQLKFVPVNAVDEKQMLFKVRVTENGTTFESVSNPGYFLYPIRPAGKPWMVGVKKGPIGEDMDFYFIHNRPTTWMANQVTIVPRKNQAWTVGCGFPGGIGMHMPGTFGYSKEGTWKGSFLAVEHHSSGDDNNKTGDHFMIEALGRKGTLVFPESISEEPVTAMLTLFGLTESDPALHYQLSNGT